MVIYDQEELSGKVKSELTLIKTIQFLLTQLNKDLLRPSHTIINSLL